VRAQNLVRKSLYYNYDYYKALGTHAFVNDDAILQLHVCEWNRLPDSIVAAISTSMPCQHRFFDC
jgi:hypothetical protein